MPGETLLPCENIAEAVQRAAEQEAGLDIPLPKQVGGQAVLHNSEMTVGEISPPRYFKNHTRYFYAIVLHSPAKLCSLGYRTFLEDKTETIRTKVFNIREVPALPDLLPQQRPLFDLLLQMLPQDNKAA